MHPNGGEARSILRSHRDPEALVMMKLESTCVRKNAKYDASSRRVKHRVRRHRLLRKPPALGCRYRYEERHRKKVARTRFRAQLINCGRLYDCESHLSMDSFGSAPGMRRGFDFSIIDRTPVWAFSDIVILPPPTGFMPERLNFQADGWAVVARPSGAIARGAAGELLMHLTREDAESIAGTLTLLIGARTATRWRTDH